MLWIYGHYKYFNYFSAWIVFIRQSEDRPYTSESDVDRRDILTYKENSRVDRRDILTYKEDSRDERVNP